jgi:hypothetical protein
MIVNSAFTVCIRIKFQKEKIQSARTTYRGVGAKYAMDMTYVFIVLHAQVAYTASPALGAFIFPTLMLAETAAPALLAPALLPVVHAETAAPALLAHALLPVVHAQTAAPAQLSLHLLFSVLCTHKLLPPHSLHLQQA